MAANWREAMGQTGGTSSSSVPKRLPPRNADYFLARMFGAGDIKGRVVGIYGNEGVGKSVLAAKLGSSNLFITDDNGILSLENHPELDAISMAVPFEGYNVAIELLDLAEEGKLINPKTGTPFDNVAFDTLSGMCSTEIRRSIDDGDIKKKEDGSGRLADNIPTQGHYLLNEQNLAPLMKRIGSMRNVSVTLLSHLRTGTKDVPGASTRADLHGAAYKLMAKYCSVVGFMQSPPENSNKRTIRVMPTRMEAAKTRLNFGKPEVTDVEFVESILRWKNK